MRRIFLVIAFFIIAIFVTAQTQQGYVKTKGRLGVNGMVIKGTRLSGAMVTVKGRNSVLSGKNGTFTLAIPGSLFSLQNVQKQGYVITDPDVLSRQYVYSKNPLILVLESKEQQIDDKLRAERKIRRNLQRQLQQREDEIETLKEENKITNQDYQEQLQKLYHEQENNEKLINDMAERYAKIDYDQIDEFNKLILKYILDGELAKADSLLKTKGDICVRAVELRQLQEQNAKDEIELTKLRKKLNKNKKLVLKELEDIAQDCFSRFEIFKMQHQMDSAEYYIKLRASLDSTNIDWKLYAADFFKNTIPDYKKALQYANEALHAARVIYGDSDLWVSRAYNLLGCIYEDKREYSQALDYFEKSLSIKKIVFAQVHPEIASCFRNMGNVYSSLGNYKEALRLYNCALDILEKCVDVDSLDIAQSYGGIGGCYIEMGNNEEALKFLEKSLMIKEKIMGNKEVSVGIGLHNVAIVYGEMKNYKKALNLDLEAISIFKEKFGETHPQLAACYINVGNMYKNLDSLALAEDMHLKSLQIYRKCLGDNIDVAMCYGNLANVYTKMGRYEESIENNKHSLLILKEKLGITHPMIAMVYTNISTTYLEIGKYEEALKYANMSLELFKEKFGDDHAYTQKVIRNISEINEKRETNIMR